MKTLTNSTHDEQSINPEHLSLMSWSVRTVDQPPKIRKLVIAICFAPAALIFLIAAWSLHHDANEDYEFWIKFFPAMTIIGFIFIAILRQKTVFNYRIYSEHAEVDFYDYFPKYSGILFKGIIGVAALLFVGLAIYTGSWLLILIGPAAVVMGSAKTLLAWEPPTPSRAISFPWREHDFVTVDRKYRIVVTHREDLTEGFDVRFPDTALMEQYLAFLRTVLPPTVQYKEEVWRW